jgi:translation initiation factor eIF-2B subunit alpha
VRFRVIYVLPPGSREGNDIVSALRKKGVPVATIPEGAVGYAMGKVDMVIVGAEGVVENGGVISRLGTYQIGVLAKGCGKPFYVVAESHKFVRIFPLGQYDLPIEQKVVEFTVDGGETVEEVRQVDEGVEMGRNEVPGGRRSEKLSNGVQDAVDFTVSSSLQPIVYVIADVSSSLRSTSRALSRKAVC